MKSHVLATLSNITVLQAYQCWPGHKEWRNDDTINTVDHFSSEEDDPLTEKWAVETNICWRGERHKTQPTFTYNRHYADKKTNDVHFLRLILKYKEIQLSAYSGKGRATEVSSLENVGSGQKYARMRMCIQMHYALHRCRKMSYHEVVDGDMADKILSQNSLHGNHS